MVWIVVHETFWWKIRSLRNIYCSILFRQAVMPARRQEGWTRQSLSWYQAIWQSSQGSRGKEPEDHKEWCRHDTRGHTAETGGASSSTEDRRSEDSGKKHHASYVWGKRRVNFSISRAMALGVSSKNPEWAEGEPGQDVQNSDGGKW